MTLTSRSPQVEELTRGVTLPLQPLTSMQMKRIVRFVKEGWDGLQRDQPVALRTHNEVEINTLVIARLNYMLRGENKWRRSVTTVRAGITSNFDGSYLERRPDIEIDVPGGVHGFPITLECKIVEDHRTRTVENYCLHGLDRFLTGSYAWGKREGFMVAYVRNGTHQQALADRLNDAMTRNPPIHAVIALPQPVEPNDPDLTESLHDRVFRYSSPHHQSAPGPIRIWHVWLRP